MEKRTADQPTCISILIADECVLIKDLHGKSHICPAASLEKIGRKLIAIANDTTLPKSDVGKLELGDQEVRGQGLPFESVDFKEQLFNQAIGLGIDYFRNGR